MHYKLKYYENLATEIKRVKTNLDTLKDFDQQKK